MESDEQETLQALFRQRVEILRELGQIDDRIAVLTATPRKPVTQGTLIWYVRKVLRQHPKGMPLPRLAAAVLEAGYATRDKRFEKAVWSCVQLRPDVVEVWRNSGWCKLRRPGR